jgi:catechol 2,3-dioxygenase-like lactoylglutathione lyase family enzyme
MMPSKFKRVVPRVTVADVQRTIDFYTQTLGFHVCGLWPQDHPTFLIVERDGACIAFDVARAGLTQLPESNLGFYIEVEDVRAVHECLRERVRVEWGPEVYHYGCREFAIRDPDGYLIIFTEETDDPPTCPVE